MKPKFAEFRLLFPRNVDESGEKEERKEEEERRIYQRHASTGASYLKLVR